LDLLGPRTEKALVYGAIDKSQDFQFIRLERMFADPDITPIKLAQDPANLYFTSAKVTLSSGNWSDTLTRIDATTLGFPRQEGIFANTPNYIYYIPTIKVPMTPGSVYNLKIEAGDSVFTSSTTLIEGVQVFTPDLTRPLSIIPSISSINPTFYLEPISTNAKAIPQLVTIVLTLNYQEKDPANGNDYVNKTYDFIMAKNQSLVGNEIAYNPSDFYQALKDDLPQKTGVIRIAKSFTITVIGGGKEFVDYNATISANAGITSTSDYPTFSNIKNGLGIFTSRSVQKFPDLGLSINTLDSLAKSRFTKDLGFK
jgi:hypothetical protein